MKVNELKALFEKNGVFQNLMPPTMKSSFHPPPRIEVQPPSKGSEIIESQEISPPPQVQILPSIRKNNDFLNQLNKKLMNKSAREKVIEGLNQQEESIPSAPKNINPDAIIFSPPRMSQIEIAVPKPAIVQEELNFDDILGNADKKGVFRSGIRARLGVNQRNPSTKEEEEMFSQWEEQRQSQLSSEVKASEEVKQNKEKTSSSPSRVTKMKVGAFHNNPLYSKLYTIDKVTRIDRILNSVFSGKSRVVISSKPQPAPQPQPMPIIVKMEAPQVQLLVKKQEVVKIEVVKQEVVELTKNEQLPFEVPLQMQSNSEQVHNRSMFAMSKEMLSEMNMKIKRRNDLINNEKPEVQAQERQNERSVSPFSKKKKTLEKFDDA